jgi:hypothetical protein
MSYYSVRFLDRNDMMFKKPMVKLKFPMAVNINITFFWDTPKLQKKYVST